MARSILKTCLPALTWMLPILARSSVPAFRSTVSQPLCRLARLSARPMILTRGRLLLAPTLCKRQCTAALVEPVRSAILTRSPLHWRTVQLQPRPASSRWERVRLWSGLLSPGHLGACRSTLHCARRPLHNKPRGWGLACWCWLRWQLRCWYL